MVRLPRPRRLLAVGLALAALAAGGLAALWVASPFPVERLARAPQSPRVLDRRGRELAARVASDEQWREWTPLEELGGWLPAAVIAIEDRRFRSHPGVDPLAVVRAAASNLASGRVVSGASTLSMQVARLVEPRPRSYAGKAREALRALQLERLRSKDEILELYLNLAPLGGNVVGAASASRRWFAKRPDELTLGEAALIAGLPQAPSRLRPDRHPEAARARRDRVLEALFEAGRITRAERDEAARAPVRLARSGCASAAPHAVQMALARRPQGGRTTLDLELQRRVEELAAAALADLPADTDCAVVVLEVERAELLVLVGSLDARDPLDGQVNGASARRSPGSALKPFVYAAAFEARRLGPDSVLADEPVDLAGWRPENLDRRYHGPVTAAEALRRSLNVPALIAAQRAGLARCLGVIESCGVDLPPAVATRSGLALVTGATEVSLLDLTCGYATLARDGRAMAPRLYADEPLHARPALSPATCRAIRAILAREPASDAGPWCKTGTSSGQRDALAIGAWGDVAAGVWVGRFGGAGHPAYLGRDAAQPLLLAVLEAAQHSAHVAAR